ncbi:MAG TPA: thioredoxin family protein [Candidatus Eisenbacteria bacterium]|nr:thioredoxin family protein [Candidatus Eisenbacteria bacterium]
MSITRGGGSIGPILWLLLLIPLTAVIGWGIGQLPTPDVPAQRAPVAAAPVAAAPVAAAPAVDAELVAVKIVEAPSSSSRRRTTRQVSDWTTYESALDESRSNGKPVLLDFNAEWCPPCKRLKRLVFEDPTYGDAVRTAVIPVSIVDRKREDGRNPSDIEDLQRRYDVVAFPTLVVFSPATGRMVKARGFRDAEETTRWIGEAAQYVR